MARAQHTGWADAMIGAEALRPVRRGDDLQAGSTWGQRSHRKPTASQRLAADRLYRYEARGRRVLAWALAPTAVGILISLIKGWLQ